MDEVLLSTIETRRPKSLKAISGLLHEESGVTAPTEMIKRRVLNLVERELVSSTRGRGFEITPEGRDALIALRTTVPDDGDD
jgi:predicted transcriptional regulator